jgi:hypothetical protein
VDWKSLLKTFVSILFGFALGLWAQHWHRFPPMPFGGPPGPEKWAERFARDFHLNESQKAEAQKIFAEQQKKVQALHEQVFPQFESIRNETRSRVREILPADERERFDSFNAELDKRMRRRPHPPDPHLRPPEDFGGDGDDHGPPPL